MQPNEMSNFNNELHILVVILPEHLIVIFLTPRTVHTCLKHGVGYLVFWNIIAPILYFLPLYLQTKIRDCTCYLYSILLLIFNHKMNNLIQHFLCK